MINEIAKLSSNNATAKLFTIIIFTKADAHVIKILQDDVYHEAIDELSGETIEDYYAGLLKGRYQIPSPPPGFFAYLRPIWKEPQSNKPLLALFDLDSSEKVPCLVTFLFHEGDVYFEKSEISGNSEQEVFNNIKEILLKLKNEIAGSENRQEAFERAKKKMKKHNNFKKSIEFMKKLSEIRGAIGF